jgi:hypothetical protein
MPLDPLRLTRWLYDWYKGTGGQPPPMQAHVQPCPLDHTPKAETIEAMRVGDRGETVKYTKPPLTMSDMVRRATRRLKTMTIPEKVEIMVKSGGMTREQADRAIKNWEAKQGANEETT